MTTTGPTNQGSRRRKAGALDPAVAEATVASPEAELAETASPEPEADAAPAESAPAEAEPSPEAERRRIRDQLEALRRREAELRVALAVADHPELGAAIRAIETQASGLARMEAKFAQGLSGSEERRKEKLEKKLAAARQRRAEIDAQIAELEVELTSLGEARETTFANARQEALSQLAGLFAAHEAALTAVGLDVTSLVPALATWQTEIEKLRGA